MSKFSGQKSVWAWALYDAGNSAFATVVMAGFFPVFFKSYWSAGVDVTVSTARLGFTSSAAGLLIALTAPLLGAIADRGCVKKRLLGIVTFCGCTATALLFATGKGMWGVAAALYGLGCIAFYSADIFYDSLLPGIAGERIHRISALGFSLGYLFGGLVFALCVLATIYPAALGTTAPDAIRASFLVTAFWWAAFTIPLLRWVPEPGGAACGSLPGACLQGYADLKKTFLQVRELKPVWLFLLAYWFYIDGVNSVIRMAVDYGLSLGFSAQDLILALLITQFVGFPCALAFGALGQRWGARNSILLGIALYGLIVVWGMRMRSNSEFYLLAVMVGVVQGGVQSLSRSYFAGLVPRGRTAEYFGFYNMVGKSSAILGPAAVGLVSYVTGSPRLGIGALLAFFFLGGLLLARSRPRGARDL